MQGIHSNTREDRRTDGGVPKDDPIDQNLIAAMQAGERTALAQLYDRHAPQMLGLAFRILNNRNDAEDLLHDVFLEAWQKAASFDATRGSVRNWLLLRVRSRAIDRLRVLAAARSHGMVEDEAEIEAVAGEDDPSQAPDQTRTRRALNKLSEVQRSVIELSYFEGLTCQEIATRCQIPVGTVKSRMAAAMATLRQAFTPIAEPD